MIVAALALAPLVMPGVSAQPQQTRPRQASDTLAISLEQALARALDESQEVRLARAELDLANAQVTGARSAALPQLSANLNYTRTFDSPFRTTGFTLPDSLVFDPDTTASLEQRVRYLERRVPTAGLGGLGSLFGDLPFGQQNTYVASLSGSQTLYAGGRVASALRVAGDFVDAARLGLTEQVAEIELQTRTAYLNALLAQELERIAAAAVEQAESFLAEERLRLESGTASELSVLRAEVALENLRPQLVEAQNAASLSVLQLKRLIDVPLQQPVTLTTALAIPSQDELEEARVAPEILLSQRAAVRAAERQVEIRQEQVNIARSAFLPSIDLRVNYGRQAFPREVFNLSDQPWRTDFNAVVEMRVPIFSGFQRQAELQQARIALDQERLRLAQTREDVQLQYEQAIGERQRAAADLSARQRTVDQAQRVHDLTVLRYEQGLATQLEVSDARLQLLQARTNLAQAISDFRLAAAGVTRALGRSSLPGGAARSGRESSSTGNRAPMRVP